MIIWATPRRQSARDLDTTGFAYLQAFSPTRRIATVCLRCRRVSYCGGHPHKDRADMTSVNTQRQLRCTIGDTASGRLSAMGTEGTRWKGPKLAPISAPAAGATTRGAIRTTTAGRNRNGCRCARSAFFFFQAEDGIRDKLVTGVQCALPIYMPGGLEHERNSAGL